MYKIVCTAGRIRHDVFHELTYEEALELCEYYDWQFDYNGGLMWDLEIEEED